jgi:hypothetical protein
MGQALSRDCPREARTLAARALSAASSSAVSALSRCSFGRDEAFVFNFSTRESSADDLADDAVICLPSWRDSSLSIKCTTPVNISPQYRRHSPLDCHSAIFAAFPVSVYPEPPEASGYGNFVPMIIAAWFWAQPLVLVSAPSGRLRSTAEPLQRNVHRRSTGPDARRHGG